MYFMKKRTPLLVDAPEAGPADPAVALERCLVAVRATLTASRAQRGAASRAVAQADVDLAADELVAAGIRPYPQLLARATGGSLSTLTPMFEDWWQRFAAARRPDAERTRLPGPLRTTLHLRHLLSALEDAARAELGLEDAHPPLENAMLAAEVTALRSEVKALKARLHARALGESTALTQQVKALEARREQLQQELEAMTYQVAQLTGQLEVRHEALRAQEDARRDALRRVEEGFARVEALLTRPLSADTALGRVAAGLERLRKDLRGASKPKDHTPARPRTRSALRARPTASRKRAGKPGRQVAVRKTTRGGHRPRRGG